jgi:hypothetical protein
MMGKTPIIIPWPREIPVGGKMLTVKQAKNLVRDEAACGTCCWNTLVISIDADLLPINKTEALIHEILEAHNKCWMAETMSHEDITRLGEAMTQSLLGMGIEIDWT